MQRGSEIGNAWLLGALACVLLSACVEQTAVRRTLLIPTATLPARIGAPLDQGRGRAGIEATGIAMPMFYSNTQGFFPGEQGDPGVLVPKLQLGGFGYFAPFAVWEIGARFLYANAAWSDRNVVGVIDLPEQQDRGLYQLGLGSRFNLIRGDDWIVPLNLALLVELNVTSMPEAVFCERSSCQGEAPSADADYTVHETRRELYLMPQLGALFGVRLAPWLFVDVIGGVTTSARNIGFDRLENIDDDTTKQIWLGYLGSGLDVHYEWLFATLHLYVPFDGQKRIDFGQRLTLQTGYAF